MFKKILLSIAVIGIASQAKEKICTPFFELINVPADYKLSTIRILKSKVEGNNFRDMITPGKDEVRYSDMSLDSNITWAKANTCQYLLLGSLTRLGETVQFSAKVIDIQTNNSVFGKAYKANDPDDLDPIFGQVASSLSQSKFVSQQSVYDVSNTDVAHLKQKRSNTSYVIGIGYLGFPAQSDNTFGFSGAMLWDARKFLGELELTSFTMGNNNGASLITFGLNLFKPLTDNENAFYLGGGTGIGIFGRKTCSTELGFETCSAKDETTLLLQGSGGYMIGRASDFNARLQADVKTGLTNINGSLPFALGFRVLIGFDY